MCKALFLLEMSLNIRISDRRKNDTFTASYNDTIDIFLCQDMPKPVTILKMPVYNPFLEIL